MGYSCAQAAANRLAMIMEYNYNSSTNTWTNENGEIFFYEIGDENSDGAITGTVYEIMNDTRGSTRPCGSFRINPDGEVACFPELNQPMRAASKGEIVLPKHPKPVI